MSVPAYTQASEILILKPVLASKIFSISGSIQKCLYSNAASVSIITPVLTA